jgi:hypothetical protein
MESDSRSSIAESPLGFVHQSSIIDKLGPLASSKRLAPEEGYKPDHLSESAQKKLDYWTTFSKFSPEVIAQLNLPAKYPDSERLKRSMRETMSYNNMMLKKSKQLFPESSGVRESIKEETSNLSNLSID